jgi:hypothetical protein
MADERSPLAVEGTMVDFTESDLLRKKVVPPAWYLIEIQSIGVWTESKDKQSKNILLEAMILKNADNGNTEFAGVPVTLQFNSKPKARGFLEGFLFGLGVEIDPGRFNLAGAQGQKLEAFVENETWEGRIRNRINHKYRQVKVAE